MNFLERYIKLTEKEDKDQLELMKFLGEVNVAIDAYARIADDMKKQNWKWDKECSELCSLRDSIQKIIEKQKKEMPNGRKQDGN